MPKTQLSRAERRHRAAIVRAARMGGALARLIRAARIACCEALPATIGPHDLIRVRGHVEAATGHLQRVLAFRFRAMLMASAEREHYLSAVEFTRLSRKVKVEEGWVDYLKLIIPAPALDFLESIVGPLWRRVVGTINPQRASDTVLQGIAAGKNRKQIADDLEEVFGGYERSARRVARDEGLRVATQAQLAVSEQIPDLIAGYSINSVLDERVRPEHRKRHGHKFYRNPGRGQKGLNECPQPPVEADGTWAYGCRCFLVPIVVGDDDV